MNTIYRNMSCDSPSIPDLTVAIPTMRRWEKFLSKSLPVYLNSSYVHTVLICDETGEDITGILASPFANHPKLLLKQNERRLGIYHNKRQCIKLAPTEWVGIFDSDNFFDENYFVSLNSIWRDHGANQTHFYACGSAQFLNDETQAVHNPIDAFAGLQINKNNWNNIFEMQNYNYLLNDGNWVVNKSVLSYLPADITDEDILATDAVFMARQFVNNGYTYDVCKELSYIHSVHDGSSWKANRDDNRRIWKTTNWKI